MMQRNLMPERYTVLLSLCDVLSPDLEVLANLASLEELVLRHNEIFGDFAKERPPEEKMFESVNVGITPLAPNVPPNNTKQR
eukprot:5785671-Amphidinium_carterae.2